MTLAELGKEYIDRSIILRAHIKQISKGLKKLNPDKTRELCARISTLYADELRCRKTGKKLINYYCRRGVTDEQDKL